ncbi:MAG: histidine phosphatase family protein [Roseburia sp.]|nr:histidine phosphatase family protein [Roseburia sp.]MCM1097843.1 histidine phosphatase family protein [Ruminococcus flavefaciens]
MKIYLIRHGQTKGNREGRYVGRTDEPLLAEAREQLLEKRNSARTVLEPDILYVSPMRRCRETARLLFPGREQNVAEDLRECDFGEFEYRNYAELNGNPAYQRFIDSGGVSGFPGGESLQQFQERCVREFRSALDSVRGRKPDARVAFVVHGGTIMAVLDRFSQPHRDYFEWQAGNGSGYAAELLYDGESGEPALVNIREWPDARA